MTESMRRPLTAAAGLLIIWMIAAAPAHAFDRWDHLLAPAATCHTSAGRSATVPAQERAMLCLINWARRKAGLRRLRRSAILDHSAAIKTGQLLRCQTFEHAPCKGIDAFQPFYKAGYASKRIAWAAGENLAWGTGPLGSPRQIMRAWLHSPHHRENILRRQWQEQGINLRVATFLEHRDAAIWTSHFGQHP